MSEQSQDRIYLDHQATTPVDDRVMEAMQPYFTEAFGNAASNDHLYGVDADQAVDETRNTIADAIGAKSDEVIFTSGATESDNIAVFGVAERYEDEGKHVITCQTEHKAVLDPCEQLEERGWEVTYLPVDEYGLVDPDDVRDAIRDDTTLVSIMMANNEVGTIAPVQEIGAIAREHDAKFHTDAAQCLGHIPIDVDEMNVDLMSMSAHKCYGPKGVGALYRRRSRPRVNVKPQMYGGGHERGLRSGTLNVPAIVGFGTAVEIGGKEMDEENERFEAWTDRMFDLLQDELGDVERNGHPEKRLAHNLNVYIPGIESRALIVDLKETAIATGSACTSADVEPSHVITAMHDERTDPWQVFRSPPRVKRTVHIPKRDGFCGYPHGSVAPTAASASAWGAPTRTSRSTKPRSGLPTRRSSFGRLRCERGEQVVSGLHSESVVF